MTTNIDASKVYQFINKYNTGDGWVKNVDTTYGNSDGYIIKSEFTKFVNDQYDTWSGESHSDSELNDIASAFWKKLDTNTSGCKISGTSLINLNALDNSETKAINKKLEVYTAFDEYMTTIAIPDGLDNSYLSDLKDALSPYVETYAENGGEASGLATCLDTHLQECSYRCAALNYAANIEKNLESTLGISLPDSYKIGDDETLQGLIDNYIEGILASSAEELPKIEDMQGPIQNIVNAYMASAYPEINGDSSLYSQKNSDSLNYLQECVASDSITNSIRDYLLSYEQSNYNTYQDAYNSAISAFVDSQLSGVTVADYSSLLNIGSSEFKNSSYYTNLQNVIKVHELYDNGNDSLSQKFTDELGDSFDTSNELYNSILQDVYSLVFSGDLDIDNVEDYIVSQLCANINSVVDSAGYDLDELSLSDLNTITNTLMDDAAKSADALGNSISSSQQLQKYKSAATFYLQVINSKNNSALASVVYDCFQEASSYSEAISNVNNMSLNKLKTALDNAISAANQMGDINELIDYFDADAYWSGLPDTFARYMDVGISTTQGKLPSTADLNGTMITTDRISWKTDNSYLSIDSSGNVSISNSTAAGTYKTTIYLYIDGVRVSQKEVTVIVGESLLDSAGALGTTNNLTALLYADGNNIGNQISTYSLSDLYNQDATVVLYWAKDKKGSDWGDKGIKDKVKGRLQDLGTSVITSLTAAGLDQSLLQKATNTVINNMMNSYYYKKKNSGDTPANAFNLMRDNRSETKSSIVNVRDTDGKNSNIYVIHFKDFVDDILTEYSKLV